MNRKMEHTKTAQEDLRKTTMYYCDRFGDLTSVMQEIFGEYLDDPLIWNDIKTLVQVQASEKGPEE